MNWYRQSQLSYDLNLKENEYRARVKIQSSKDNIEKKWEANIDEDVEFVYLINLDKRNWGIKGIDVVFRDSITVTLLINYFDFHENVIKEERKPLIIDMSKLTVNYVSGYGIYIVEIDIQLTKELEVDYENSYVTVSKGGQT
jgi:hypothetical protein